VKGKCDVTSQVNCALGVVATVFLSTTVLAAENDESRQSLQQIVSRALQTHPTLSAAQAEYMASERRVEQAEALFLPTVSSAAEFGEGWRNDLDRQYLTLTASQILYDFGQARAQVKIEQADREVLYTDYQIARNDIAVDVAEAYVEIIRHYRLIDTIDEKLSRLNDIQDIAETRLSFGGSDNADLVLTRSRYQSALSEKVELQSMLRQWQQILSTLSQTPVVTLDSNLDAIDQFSCTSNRQLIGESLYVKNSQNNVNVARSTYDYSSRKKYPQISLQVGARQLLRSSQFEPRDQDYRVEIKFEMDLYNGGRNRAQAASSLHLVESATMTAEATRLDISRQAQSALNDINFIDEKISILQAQQLAAGDARDLFLEQYRTMGNRSLTDILNNEEEIAHVSMQIVNADMDRKLALLECASLTGNIADVFNTAN